MTYEVPFDTDPWNQIIPGLFQGGHLIRHGLGIRPVIVREEFELVVSLYKEHGYGPDPGVPEVRALIPDGHLTARQWQGVNDIVPIIVGALEADRKVLVRCQAGYNRSGLLVALTLMTLGNTAQEAIDLIRQRRSEYALCNDLFVGYLLDGGPQ